MSQWNDLAEAIATEISKLTKLEGIDVIVDRQKDLNTEIEVSVAKLSGVAVVVQWQEPSLKSRGSRVSPAKFLIHVYGCPILQGDDAVPADDVLEAIMPVFNGWKKVSGQNCAYDVEHDGSAQMLPSNDYVIWELPLKAAVELPAPEFQPTTP
jgi:hypothetical protein